MTDTWMARDVQPGWHMDGVGRIDRVVVSGGRVTFWGPSGHRMFAKYALVEASDGRPAEEHPAIARAEVLGRAAGVFAASWVFDGNTPTSVYRLMLAGITDGDPLVLDAWRTPDLSGEFADGMTPRELADQLGIDDAGIKAGTLDAACSAWEDAARDGFWHEVERVARVQLDADEDE